MIYFFYGKDKLILYKKASKLFDNLRLKKPDASFLSFDAEQLSIDSLDSLIQSRGLFENKIVAYLKNVLSEGELEKEILKYIEAMAKSENIFIWTEYDISPSTLTIFKKKAEKIEELEDKKIIKNKEEFNIFDLADAFGKRDKKNLWAMFQKARKNAVPEEIHGILFWQLKNIALALTCSNPNDAGLKPFVYSKAKVFAKNYNLDEVKKISSKMMEIYHDAHRGKGDLDLSLEKLILSL